MGSLPTVFQAEVMAILTCTEHLLPKNVTRRMHICSESRAAIAALVKLSPNWLWYRNLCKRWKINLI